MSSRIEKIARHEPGHKKKKKKKGSLGKAVAMGAAASGGISAAKGFSEKAIDTKLEKGTGKASRYLRASPRGRWAIARALPGAASGALHTLSAIKAVEAARGKKF